jgi:hypothetical protein
MGRPALPKSLHILKGTAKKNPARLIARENEPENIKPIGTIPSCLNKQERAAWRRIVSESIPGVLGRADRMGVELASRLYARVNAGEASGIEHNQLIKLLSQFGMLPADRSKISIVKPKIKNQFDF